MINDDELLEKYNEIWENVRNSIKKRFDIRPVYNKKYLKHKLISNKVKTNTNFHSDKLRKEDSNVFA